VKSFKVKAPAKVNLCLNVLKKRPDGYHELDTLFESLHVWDVLRFSKGPSRIRLTCSIKSLPTGPKNLVYKAALLLKERYGVTSGVQIHLQKNLPVASGLGGGSSDAASTLLALNRFWNLRLSQKVLLKHAAELGSDIPFFILKSPYAIGRGRGDRLQQVSTRYKLWHVLITPRLYVLAKDVYRALKPGSLTRSRTGARMLKLAVQNRDFKKLKGLLSNTLEHVLLEKYPVIRRLKNDLLEAGAEVSLVSGSGPTVFGITRSKRDAQNIMRKLRRKHPTKKITVASTAFT